MVAIRERSALAERSSKLEPAPDSFVLPTTDAFESHALLTASVRGSLEPPHANEVVSRESPSRAPAQSTRRTAETPRSFDAGSPRAADAARRPGPTLPREGNSGEVPSPSTLGATPEPASRADNTPAAPLNEPASTESQSAPIASAITPVHPLSPTEPPTPQSAHEAANASPSEPPRLTSRTPFDASESVPSAPSPSSEPREPTAPRAAPLARDAMTQPSSQPGLPRLVDPAQASIAPSTAVSPAPRLRSEDQPSPADVSPPPVSGPAETPLSPMAHRGLASDAAQSFENTQGPSVHVDGERAAAASPTKPSSPRVIEESPRESEGADDARELVADTSPPRFDIPPSGSRATPAATPPPNEERRARRPMPAAPDQARQASDDGESRASDRSSDFGSVDEPASSEPLPTEAPAAGRSLTEWRRLLFEATSAQPDVKPPQVADKTPAARSAPPRNAPPSTPARPSVEPLLESTRQFLQPRVGIDPATVPIVRSAVADRMLDKLGADAAAFGEVVALPTAADERSPEVRAVLAHELTHVAQRRIPRFVPPAVRPTVGADERRTPRFEQPAFSEERLARGVERAALDDATISHETRTMSDPTSAERLGESTRDVVSVGLPAVGLPAVGSRAWGNLPAPWEPLPYISDSPGLPGAAFSPAPAAADTPVHLAEHGRRLDDHDAPALPSEHAHAADPASAAPDLDVLARKVYDVLKRRLAAERRREG